MAGSLDEEVAYYPYGEPRNRYERRFVVPPQAYLFTQKERDEESGLNYFEARYLVGSGARFLRVDPMGRGAEADPQRLNSYAYALNRPVVSVDPSGMDPPGHVELDAGGQPISVPDYAPAGPPGSGGQGCERGCETARGAVVDAVVTGVQAGFDKGLDMLEKDVIARPLNPDLTIVHPENADKILRPGRAVSAGLSIYGAIAGANEAYEGITEAADAQQKGDLQAEFDANVKAVRGLTRGAASASNHPTVGLVVEEFWIVEGAAEGALWMIANRSKSEEAPTLTSAQEAQLREGRPFVAETPELSLQGFLASW